MKSEAAQASAVIFRTRDLLVRQRTQHINAVRGHLAEYGLVAANGPANLPKLLRPAEESRDALPADVSTMLEMLADVIVILDERITRLDHEVARRAKTEDIPRRLMTIPGVGPITATALAALAPPPETFRKGRDFSA